MTTLSSLRNTSIEQKTARDPRNKERRRTNDSGIGVSRQSSNASTLTTRNGTASDREKRTNNSDSDSDYNELNIRNSDASNVVPRCTASHQHTLDGRVESTKTTDSKCSNVSLIVTHANGIESKAGENGNGDEAITCSSTAFIGNNHNNAHIDAKIINPSTIEPNRGYPKSSDLSTLHSEVNDVDNAKERHINQYHNKCNHKTVQPLLAACSVNLEHSDKTPNRLPVSTKTRPPAGHRKNKSDSCELAIDNELTSKCSIAKRRRYYSEGRAESEQLLKPNGQPNIINKWQTGCSDSVSPGISIENNKHVGLKTTSGCNFGNNSADEDIDSVETFKTSELKIVNNKNIVDHDYPDSSSFITLELQRQSEPSEQPSPTLTHARQELDTRLNEIYHGKSDLEDPAKHSTTVNVDTDNFESDAETCDPLPLVDTENDNNENCDKTNQCQCCSACSDHYAELHSKIDAIIHDYQWAAKRLDDMLSSTRDLKVFKGRATKVGAVALAVILILVCGSAATNFAMEQFYGNGMASQMFGQNVTTRIAELHEQYVSVSDMVNDLMTRSKSVIHVTNGGRMTRHGGSYFVRWMANENHGQGSLALSEAGDAIVAPTGGYYRISAKMHYKATMENITSVKLEYDLVRSSGGHHELIRHAVREFPAASGSLQYELQLDTTMYVYSQDAILVSVRPDQKQYLADFDRAHEFTMLEVG